GSPSSGFRQNAQASPAGCWPWRTNVTLRVLPPVLPNKAAGAFFQVQTTHAVRAPYEHSRPDNRQLLMSIVGETISRIRSDRLICLGAVNGRLAVDDLAQIDVVLLAGAASGARYTAQAMAAVGR